MEAVLSVDEQRTMLGFPTILAEGCADEGVAGEALVSAGATWERGEHLMMPVIFLLTAVLTSRLSSLLGTYLPPLSTGEDLEEHVRAGDKDLDSTEAVLRTGAYRLTLDLSNLLTTFLVSCHHGTVLKERGTDDSCIGWAGVAIGSVRAALAVGESRKWFGSLILLMMLPGLGCLALSVRGPTDGLAWVRRGNPVLERARDRVSLDLESGRIPKAPMGCLGMAREFRVGSRLIVDDSSADMLGIGSG
jgi:hypothetical protein